MRGKGGTWGSFRCAEDTFGFSKRNIWIRQSGKWAVFLGACLESLLLMMPAFGMGSKPSFLSIIHPNTPQHLSLQTNGECTGAGKAWFQKGICEEVGPQAALLLPVTGTHVPCPRESLLNRTRVQTGLLGFQKASSISAWKEARWESRHSAQTRLPLLCLLKSLDGKIELWIPPHISFHAKLSKNMKSSWMTHVQKYRKGGSMQEGVDLAVMLLLFPYYYMHL